MSDVVQEDKGDNKKLRDNSIHTLSQERSNDIVNNEDKIDEPLTSNPILERIAAQLESMKVEILKKLGLFISDGENEMIQSLLSIQKLDDSLDHNIQLLDEELRIFSNYWKDEMILRIKSGMIRKEDIEDYSLNQFISGDVTDNEKRIVALTQDIKKKEKESNNQYNEIALLSSLVHRREEMMDLQRKQYIQELMMLREQGEKRLISKSLQKQPEKSDLHAYVNVLHRGLSEKMKSITSLVSKLRDVANNIDINMTSGLMSPRRKEYWMLTLNNIEKKAETLIKVNRNCTNCQRLEHENAQLTYELAHEKMKAKLRIESDGNTSTLASKNQQIKSEKEAREKKEEKKAGEKISAIFKLQERSTKMSGVITSKNKELEEKTKSLEIQKENVKRLKAKIRLLKADVQRLSTEMSKEKDKSKDSFLNIQRLMMIKEDLFARLLSLIRNDKKHPEETIKVQNARYFETQQATNFVNNRYNAKRDSSLRSINPVSLLHSPQEARNRASFHSESKGHLNSNNGMQYKISEDQIHFEYYINSKGKDRQNANFYYFNPSGKDNIEEVKPNENELIKMKNKDELRLECKILLKKKNANQSKDEESKYDFSIAEAGRRTTERFDTTDYVDDSYKNMDLVVIESQDFSLSNSSFPDLTSMELITAKEEEEHLQTEESLIKGSVSELTNSDLTSYAKNINEKSGSNLETNITRDNHTFFDKINDKNAEISGERVYNNNSESEHGEGLLIKNSLHNQSKERINEIKDSEDLQFDHIKMVSDMLRYPDSSELHTFLKVSKYGEATTSRNYNSILSSIQRQYSFSKILKANNSKEKLVSGSINIESNSNARENSIETIKGEYKTETENQFDCNNQALVQTSISDIYESNIKETADGWRLQEEFTTDQTDGKLLVPETLLAAPKEEEINIKRDERKTNASVFDVSSVSIAQKLYNSFSEDHSDILLEKVNEIQESLQELKRIKKEKQQILRKQSKDSATFQEELNKCFAKKFRIIKQIETSTEQMYQRISTKRMMIEKEQTEKWERALRASNFMESKDQDEKQESFMLFQEGNGIREEVYRGSSPPKIRKSWRPNSSPYSDLRIKANFVSEGLDQYEILKCYRLYNNRMEQSVSAEHYKADNCRINYQQREKLKKPLPLDNFIFERDVQQIGVKGKCILKQADNKMERQDDLMKRKPVHVRSGCYNNPKKTIASRCNSASPTMDKEYKSKRLKIPLRIPSIGFLKNQD